MSLFSVGRSRSKGLYIASVQSQLLLSFIYCRYLYEKIYAIVWQKGKLPRLRETNNFFQISHFFIFHKDDKKFHFNKYSTMYYSRVTLNITKWHLDLYRFYSVRNCVGVRQKLPQGSDKAWRKKKIPSVKKSNKPK